MKIDIQPTTYYSEQDEENFFTWALDIECVERTHSGYLFIDKLSVNENSLRELIALFHRYNVNSTCLAVFCNSENEAWFKNSEMYWYNNIFNNNV